MYIAIKNTSAPDEIDSDLGRLRSCTIRKHSPSEGLQSFKDLVNVFCFIPRRSEKA